MPLPIALLMKQQSPDFSQLLRVLKRKPTKRPVLFEFIVDPRVMLPGVPYPPVTDKLACIAHYIQAFHQNGYDFCALPAWVTRFFNFPDAERQTKETFSLNDGVVVSDWESFQAIEWEDPAVADYSLLDQAAKLLPEGMKFIVMGPSGALENTVSLTGYENLCYLLGDEPELVSAITEAIGSRLLTYYEKHLEHESVGAVVVNDDWGFKTSTLLSPSDLRTYIFPWHKRVVELAHTRGRPAILRSCGYMGAIWEDIIEDMGYDAKHSYEDIIEPVEEAHKRLGQRIAILGGMDIDFLCMSEPQEVYKRCRRMLEQTKETGGYALGSGNSIVSYMPRDNYLAMTRAALEGY